MAPISGLHFEQHLELIVDVLQLGLRLPEGQRVRVGRLHPVLGRRGQCWGRRRLGPLAARIMPRTCWRGTRSSHRAIARSCGGDSGAAARTSIRILTRHGCTDTLCHRYWVSFTADHKHTVSLYHRPRCRILRNSPLTKWTHSEQKTMMECDSSTQYLNALFYYRLHTKFTPTAFFSTDFHEAYASNLPFSSPTLSKQHCS